MPKTIILRTNIGVTALSGVMSVRMGCRLGANAALHCLANVVHGTLHLMVKVSHVCVRFGSDDLLEKSIQMVRSKWSLLRKKCGGKKIKQSEDFKPGLM